MWGGPLDPSGSYNLLDQYSDGTKVFRNDFNDDRYPNNRKDQVARLYTKFGDLDYFYHSPPSAACTSIRLFKSTDDDNVYSNVDSWNQEDQKRSVVCLGN